MLFHKNIHTPPSKVFLVRTPPTFLEIPVLNNSLASHFPLKTNWLVKLSPSPPLGISNDPPRGGYGYFPGAAQCTCDYLSVAIRVCGFSDVSEIFLGFISLVAFHNAIPFVGFGFLDNAIMIIAVSID